MDSEDREWSSWRHQRPRRRIQRERVSFAARCRAARQVTDSIPMEVLDRLKRHAAHDPLGTTCAAEGTKQPFSPQNPRATTEEPSEQAVPRRARIRRGVTGRLGPTAGCPKCSAIRDGDPGCEAVGSESSSSSSRCRWLVSKKNILNPSDWGGRCRLTEEFSSSPIGNPGSSSCSIAGGPLKRSCADLSVQRCVLWKRTRRCEENQTLQTLQITESHDDSSVQWQALE